jgi:hypothetical protein
VGDGEAAGIQAASLSLTPGDAPKYVYDFGDWTQLLDDQINQGDHQIVDRHGIL